MTATHLSPNVRAGLREREGRKWFLLDALVTGANGVMYLAGAGVLAELFGASPSLQRGAGTFLAVFAAVVGWYALNRATSPGMGWGVIAVNIAWVAGSLAVAAAGPGGLTAIGRTWLVAQAAVVGMFAVLQTRSLLVAQR